MQARKVFKYTLRGTRMSVRMPEGAQLLHVASQDDVVCLWALVETNPCADMCERHFVVTGTGFLVPEDAGQYVGTALCYDAKLVLHVFETPAAA